MDFGNHISWEVRKTIGYISFCNPPENKMTVGFFKELKFIVKEVIPSSEAKAIIILGLARHFSSGADLDSLLTAIKNEESGGDTQQTLHSNYELFLAIENIRMPVIAAIKGVCIGSALELALHCHFRICSADAILGLPETTFDLMPGVGGIPKMIDLAGKAKALELILAGNTFNATEALKLKLVDAVYPKKHVMEMAERLAEMVINNYRIYRKTDYLRKLMLVENN